jgi:hypothetical protein
MKELLGAVLMLSLAASAAIGAALTPQQMGLQVTPTKGQDPQTQSKDETDCYTYARQQTGFDPSIAQSGQPVQGQGIRGGARGAAAGAAIGAAAGSPGQGAAVGGSVGAVRGRRQSRMAAQQEQAGNSQQVNGFKGVMSSCLQNRGYTVK